MSRYRSSRLRPPASDTPIDDALRRAPRPAVTPRVAIGAALLAGGIAVGCSDGPLSSAKDEAFAPGVRFDLAALQNQPGVPPVCDEADLVSLTVRQGGPDGRVVFTGTNRNKEDAVQGPGIPSSASCVHSFPLEFDEAGQYTFQARVSGGDRSLELGTIQENVEDGFTIVVPLIPQPALGLRTEVDRPTGRLGDEPPESYGFRIDGASPPGAIGRDDEKTIFALAARQRAVELTGFAPCNAIARGRDTTEVRGVNNVSAAQVVPPDPQEGLDPGVLILPEVAFNIRCYGHLRVVAITTTGTPPGPDGYNVTLLKDGQPLHSNPYKVGHPRDSVEIPNVFATNTDSSTDVYVVTLDAAPCTTSPMSREVDIRPDTTSRVVFDVTCVEPQEPNLAAPSSLSFSEVKIGESCAQPVTIGNTGTADLTVSAISISGVGFSFTAPSTPFTIPPGASQTVIVSFSPPGPGGFNGSLTVTSNDPDTPLHTVNLFGRQGGTTACP